MLILQFFYIAGCDKGIIQSKQEYIVLSPEFIAATNLWLSLRIEATNGQKKISIFQDDSLINTFILQKTDTILKVINLEENTKYSFRAEYSISNSLIYSSNLIQINTGKLSSSIINWKDMVISEIGAGLLDVEYLNENNIFAVGYFLHEGQYYNGIHYSNLNLEYEKIPILVWGATDSSYSYSFLSRIVPINLQEYWVTNGGAFMYYDGKEWGNYQFLFKDFNDPLFGDVRDTWKGTTNDIWAIGDKGSIYHYDGNNWSRTNSPTKENIRSIAGSYQEGQLQLVIGGFNFLYYRIGNSEWQDIFNTVLGRYNFSYKNTLKAGFLDADNLFIAVWADGETHLFRINPANMKNAIHLGSYPEWCSDMIVVGKNDIFFTGNSGIFHYNGDTIVAYPVLDSGDYYEALSYYNHEIAIVGHRNQLALLIIGNR